MNGSTSSRRRIPIIWIAVVLAALAALVAALAARRWRKRRAQELAGEKLLAPPALPAHIKGLTEAQAEARRLEGQDNSIQFTPPRTRSQILRDNILNIFNLNLVGLVTVQLLLQRPLDALISFGVMSLNIVVNIAQESLARRMLRNVEQAGRPQATVIREGVARSIEASQVVRGDVLAVGPGDPFFVDGELLGEGEIVVDESMLTQKAAHRKVSAGDEVFAGSFCVSGRSAYRAHKVGDERLIITLAGASERAKKVLTPLEQVINRVLRLLLVIVAAYTVMLLTVYFGLDTGVPAEEFNSAAAVIFNIAPAGLFFMIFLNYTMGTANLGRLGALVHQSRSVESLAQADTMCFAQAGVLTGTDVELERIDSPGDQEQFAESRIRQILGDYARSTTGKSLITRAMETTFEGNWRAPLEEAPFLSHYGWSAIAFDDDDLRGVYVLGDPQVLQIRMATDRVEPVQGRIQAVSTRARKVFAPLGRLFRRSDQTSEADSAKAAQQNGPESAGRLQARATPPSEDDTSRPNLFRRVIRRVNRTLRRPEKTPEEAEAAQELETPEPGLLFAYRPQLVRLHAEDGSPQLPDGLIPVCTLRFTERMRPEAIETMRTFLRTGVSIKIFSPHAPDRTLALLKAAGAVDDETSPGTVSGFELAIMDPAQLAQAATDNTIFGHLTSAQARQVVDALREDDHSVAVMGDGVNDLPAMRGANLAIARQSSTQAALSVADILLLQDSPRVLQQVLDRGQRVVNGLLDVLKISLTQVFCLALLILIILIFSEGFPYSAKQGSVVNLITVVLPSVGLSLFAAAGILSTTNFGRLLARFVAPAAVTISAAALAVYVIFLRRTGEIDYAQLTLTYTLVVCGLLLVIFVRPPIGLRPGGGGLQSGDWRPTAMVVLLLAAFLLLAPLPIMYELFEIDALRERSDYLVVAAAALVWAVALRIVWWVIPLAPVLSVPEAWLSQPEAEA